MISEHRYFPPLAVFLVLAAAAAGCPDGGGIQGPNRLAGASASPPGAAGSETPAPKASGLSGGVGDDVGSSASPGTQPATPVPSGTAPAGDAGASLVRVAPQTVKISLPAEPGEGAEAGLPATARLSAVVTWSDGSTISAVTWSSLDPAVATVDSTGLVSAVGPGQGPQPWSVGIKATSLDGKASSIRQVVVSGAGNIAVTVQ